MEAYREFDLINYISTNKNDQSTACPDKYNNQTICMNHNRLTTTIVEGIQEKKGKKVTVVDLRKFENAACSYFVICEGDSNTHVSAIAHAVKEYVREHAGVKPVAVDGLDNAWWVAMDYTEAIVHVFQREPRTFYDIEHLWADAEITEIPDLD
jgi:ribosome-associated protein